MLRQCARVVAHAHGEAAARRWMSSVVMFKDENLIAISKRPGLSTQGDDPALAKFLARYQYDSSAPPRVVDQLDNDTSGVLLLSRNDQAHRRLSGLLTTGAIRKTYLAVVLGVPNPVNGAVALDLVKSNVAGKWRLVPSTAGPSADTDIDVSGSTPSAITRYETISQRELHAALVKLQPNTSRQHQPRAHLAALQCPIFGDSLYGPGITPWLRDMLRLRSKPQLHLHVLRLVVPDYWPGKAAPALVLETAPPLGFKDTLRGLGLSLKKPSPRLEEGRKHSQSTGKGATSSGSQTSQRIPRRAPSRTAEDSAARGGP
eukprot:m.98864 g.98864  ORF g.98864 m.98864 type:complete len:316 (-) comp8704_c0_seq1:1629-2576(-)